MEQKNTDKVINDGVASVGNNEQEIKKQFLIWMFSVISKHTVKFEMDKSIQEFRKRGFTTEEAKQEVRNKYQQLLLQDNVIVDAIIENSGEDIYNLHVLFDDTVVKESETDKIEECRRLHIEHISNKFCKYDFTIADDEIIIGKKNVKEIQEIYIAYGIVQILNWEKEPVITRIQSTSLTIPDEILDELERAELISKEPLKWIGSVRLCAYFADTYFSGQNKKWKKAKLLFGVENLAQQKDGYVNSKSGKPRGYQVIDTILEKHR